jgi:hypothetical protein
VGPDATPAPALLEHCPHCRGAVRPGAPWCTQCWTDLRPAPAPVVPPAVEPPPPAAAPGPQPGPVAPGPVDGAGWPCSTCGAVNAFELDACAACGAGFLTALRAQEGPLLVIPGVGDLGQLGRGQRLALSAGVALALALLVGLLGLLTM